MHDSQNLLTACNYFEIFFFFFFFFFLSLAPQPSLGLGLLHKIWLNFLEASQQFFFLQGRVVSPTPNPYPGVPGLWIYIPWRQGLNILEQQTKIAFMKKL
jgi:hypothetical protein